MKSIESLYRMTNHNIERGGTYHGAEKELQFLHACRFCRQDGRNSK